MKLYFLGIGGTAMGNLAIVMKSLGHEIFGADEKVYSPMSDLLHKAGIKYFEGYNAEHLPQVAPDKIIIGNALSRGNPEVEYILTSKKFDFISLPEMIKKSVIKDRPSIVITGTHGKTTTTTMTTFLLQKNGINPGHLIGGAPLNFSSGADYGHKNAPFVIEGDEYDSAFFDKRSKFVHYFPEILVINNIELDHIDIFRDIDDIKRTFSHVIRLVPQNGCIIANGDSEVIRELLPIEWTNTIFVGKNPGNDFILADEKFSQNGTEFRLKGKDISGANIVWDIKSPLFGEHNARNAAMAVLATYVYTKNKNIITDFSGFLGLKKRQEVVLKSDKCIVISDFAHHPTAIQETIKAIKQAYPEYKIITAFEPRSNTACSNCFQKQFQHAFRGSDRVYIMPVFKKRTRKILNIKKLVANIDYCPCESMSIEDLQVRLMSESFTEKVLFLCLSNGSFANLPQTLAKHFE